VFKIIVLLTCYKNDVQKNLIICFKVIRNILLRFYEYNFIFIYLKNLFILFVITTIILNIAVIIFFSTEHTVL